MVLTIKEVLLALIASAAAAPINDSKRQFDDSTLPSFSLPAGGSPFPTSTSGIGGLETPSATIGGLSGSSSLPGGLGGLSEGSTGTGLGFLGSLGGSSSGLGSLGGGGTGVGTTGSTDDSVHSTTDSGMTDSTGCRPLILIFARGTGEPGALGTVVGTPVANALKSAFGEDKVDAQGVDYPADAAGNASLGASGGPKMASMAKQAVSSCPSSKVVLGGYSQGAMVVHNALSSQGLDGSKVAAVVAFGDPFNGQAFKGVDASKSKEFCGSGDFLCSSGGTTGSGSHLSYTSDADAAAKFIISATALSA